MSLNPLDLTGGPFLAFYLGLLACAIAAGVLVPRIMRPAGRRQDLSDPEELAVLAGGTTRLAETVVAKLLAARALTMVGRGLYEPAADATGSSAAERGVLAGTTPSKWDALEKRVAAHAEDIARKLVAAGLMVDEAQAGRVRLRQTLPYVLLLCLGTAKLVLGLARDRPVGYLAALLVVTAVAAALRWRRVERATSHGRAAIERARDRSSRLRRAPTRAETGPAVALFGTSVLIGSGLADFHQARAATPGDGGASSGGGGGDSDGGGGCGGCGGD